MECLECKKNLAQTAGKRAKFFCNNTCRSNHWQKKKRVEKKEDKNDKISDKKLSPKITIPLPKNNEEKHPFWMEGDPKEGSGSFYLKFNVSTYNEMKSRKD